MTPSPQDDAPLSPSAFEQSTLAPAPNGGATHPAVGPPSPAPDVDRVRVPGYEVLREVGRGGMGVVYEARQARLNRVVALKMILSGEHAGEDDVARFRTEAEAIARLQHPNIVQIHEVGEHDGRPFFSLEFCPGGSLENKLSGRPLPAEEAARLAETLARAVHAAHRKGVVHRDLKPANVLLAEDGTPKVTDFGLAKKTDETGKTATGVIMGTPSYMAPEQAAGLVKEVGPPADVHALGAILYELLTGRPPFRAATRLDTLLQVMELDAVPVRQLNPRCPRDLETICLKCLRKIPKERYAGAQDLADDLRRFLDGEPVKARPPGSLRLINRWVRHHPGVIVAYLTAAVLLLPMLSYLGLPHVHLAAMSLVPARSFYLATLPAVFVVLIGVLHTRLRVALPAALVLSVAAGVGWYYMTKGRADVRSQVWLPLALSGAALGGVILGLMARSWRATVFGFLPALLGIAVGGWALNKQQEVRIAPAVLMGGAAPGLPETTAIVLSAGALHGLVLGAMARVVAWGLNREKALVALGAVVGALGGILLTLLYEGQVLRWAVPLGRAVAQYRIVYAYNEVLAAHVGAVLFGLLARRRGSGRAV